MYVKDSAGAGAEETLAAIADSLSVPRHWSADGKYLVFVRLRKSRDIWVLPLDGDRKPFPLVATTFDETNAQFSPGPNPKWFAYDSHESGIREVYVQTFPPGGGKSQISNAGGGERLDGQELYYVTPDRHLMAVDVKLGTGFRPVYRGSCFRSPPLGGPVYGTHDVSADGQKSLMLTSAGEQRIDAITVVLNWQSELKR